MSKTELKKYLKTLTADELVDVIMEAYDARKQTKEYFEYYLNPDEKGQVAKINELIRKEFYSTRGKRKCRVSGIKKAIREFEKLYPDPMNIVTVKFNFVLACVEVGSSYFGFDRLFRSAETMFAEALKDAGNGGIFKNVVGMARKIVEMDSGLDYVLNEALQDYAIREIVESSKPDKIQ